MVTMHPQTSFPFAVLHCLGCCTAEWGRSGPHPHRGTSGIVLPGGWPLLSHVSVLTGGFTWGGVWPARCWSGCLPDMLGG